MKQKIDEVKVFLADNYLDGLMVSNAVNISYITGYSNFSEDEREAFLLFTKDKKFLFTDGRYTEEVSKQVENFTLIEKGISESLIESVIKIIQKLKLKKIGFEGEDLTFNEYEKLSSESKLIKADLSKIRMIKNFQEIKLIKEACNLTDKTLAFALSKINLKISEKELAFEIEHFIKQNGGSLAFDSIVAFDIHSSRPHHQTSQTILDVKKGNFLLFDLGAKLNGYCSDMTRTVFLGKPTKKQIKIYKTVLEAQQKASEFIQAEISRGKIIQAREVDSIARKYIKSCNYPDIPHGLGHGVGFKVHEAPRLSKLSNDTLTSGMVFSIEPGIYIPNFGGVRIEDLFVIEGKSLKQLTKSPKEIIVV